MDVSLKESKEVEREVGWVVPAAVHCAGRGHRLSGVRGSSAHQPPSSFSQAGQAHHASSCPAHRSGCPRGLEQAPALTEAPGASPSITQTEEPQILRSLSASVMLKGKLAVAAVHSHSSLLKAALAQDSLGDKSVVCSAASADRAWGQGQGLRSWKNL